MSETTISQAVEKVGEESFSRRVTRDTLRSTGAKVGLAWVATVAVLVSVVTLAYQLKVQRQAFFARLPETLAGLGREPRMMALAMILLAVICVALSLAVLGGLDDPWLIGDAQRTLAAGIFGS